MATPWAVRPNALAGLHGLGENSKFFVEALVVMIPRPNRDLRKTKLWRPTSPLSCLVKRYAVDIINAMTHDIETQSSQKRVATFFIADVIGALKSLAVQLALKAT